MAHAHSNSNKANARDGEAKRTTFHDFLSNKGQPQEASLPANSDLATERHAGHHLEGVPFYGSRGDLTGGPESSNRLPGNKRRSSDSFLGSSADKLLRGQADLQDSPLLSKLLRYSGVEQNRRQVVSHSPTDVRADTSASILDRALPVNIGPTLHYPPRAGQVTPFGYQAPSNRFRDANTGPSVISQTAADEGSRTGMKGSGLLSSMNATRAISGRQPSGVLIRSGKQKSGISISEPESATTLRQHGSESGGGQMTIFYGGQAHVFDSVHRSKADVIMALAGSNGGSWSTSYKPNPATMPSAGDYRLPSGENDAILKELHQRPLDKVDQHGRSGSGD